MGGLIPWDTVTTHRIIQLNIHAFKDACDKKRVTSFFFFKSRISGEVYSYLDTNRDNI